MSRGRSIRVCFCTSGFPPNFTGYGLKTLRTLPHLQAQGLLPAILTQRGTGGPGTENGGVGVRVHRVLASGRHPWSRLLRIAQFRRFFTRHAGAFDLIHTTLLGWELMLNLPFLEGLGLPVVLEMVLLDGDDPLTLSRERFGRVKLRLMRHVDAWLGISAAFQPRVKAVGLPEARFHLVHNAVDTEVYRPADSVERRAVRGRLHLPADGRIVLSVGSLMPRKGMDRVMNSWMRVRPQPGRDLLLLVGPRTIEEGLSPAYIDHADELARLARAPATSATVRLAGRRDDIPLLMRAADAFLFLSRQEGFGTVILEAMASGLPCIVSHLDGIAAEIIDHGRTGFIVANADDPMSVAATLKQVLSNPELREGVGKDARRIAAERFSFQQRAGRLREIYDKVLAGRR